MISRKNNPFADRSSEMMTSDHEFIYLFSPEILRNLNEDIFQEKIHIFRSPPGGGKTTLFRCFSPRVLREFSLSTQNETNDTKIFLKNNDLLNNDSEVRLLSALLSCSSGYQDLPPLLAGTSDGLFRALLNCRIIIRSLKSLIELLDLSDTNALNGVNLIYENSLEFNYIPITRDAKTLYDWAINIESQIYQTVDSFRNDFGKANQHIKIESTIWLSEVQFYYNGRKLRLKRLLMFDDLHNLQAPQRNLLLDELTTKRTSLTVWLAERIIVLGSNILISKGARSDRELREIDLSEEWTKSKGGNEYKRFGMSVLKRRSQYTRNEIFNGGLLEQFLCEDISFDEYDKDCQKLLPKLESFIKALSRKDRYHSWVSHLSNSISDGIDVKTLKELVVKLIFLSRDAKRSQSVFSFEELPVELYDDIVESPFVVAADLFLHKEIGLPIYYGMDKILTMSSANIEELLGLASDLYEGIRGKFIMRANSLKLTAKEQEVIVIKNAEKRRRMIPKSQDHGNDSVRLLDAIGEFCREKTFQPNAPYAPGVTGVRITDSIRIKMSKKEPGFDGRLTDVLSEMIAQNLLITRPSAASTNRESGLVLYLNRGLCPLYQLPLQQGGWQDVSYTTLSNWMENGVKGKHQFELFSEDALG